MPKPRPKTGEARVTRHTFGIDRLPPAAHDAILRLRNGLGKTWQEIEDLSAEPMGDGLLGFIDWVALPTPVLELFPDMRIPRSNLHRWYDVRVEQVARDVRNRSAQAREIAEAFASSVVEDGDEAVVNAARDTIMSMLAEDGTAKGRSAASRALVALAEVMQAARANDIKERKVATEERKLKLLEQREALAIKRMEAETEKLAKKATTGTVLPEDIDRLRQRVFSLPPIGKHDEAA